MRGIDRSTRVPRVPRLALAIPALLIAVSVARAQGGPPAAGTSDRRDAARTPFAPLRADAAPAPLAARVTVTLRDVPLGDALQAVGREAGIGIVFDDALPGLDRRVSLNERRASAAAVVLRLLDASSLQAFVAPSGQVIVVRVRRADPSPLGGAVRDSATGVPLAGARVDLLGTGFGAVVRPDGRFTIPRVPRGDYTARVAQIGYRPALAAVRIGDDGAGPTLAVSLARAPLPLSAVVITPGYFGIMQPTLGARQTMTREQLEAAPQIGEDVFRAIARLPGIAGNDLTAQFHLRGAPQDQLYVTLDGLELVEPFHLKELDNAVSIIDVKAIGAVELTSGGFSAEYGDRLTGVLTMRSIEPRTDRTHASAGLSITNARVNADGGFAGGRGGWLVSARRGYVDLAMKFTDAADSYKPRYGDAFAKVQYALPWGGRVAAHALYASDDLHFVDSTDVGIVSRYRSAYGWLTWDDTVGARLTQRTVASLAALSWRRGGVGFDDWHTAQAALTDRRGFHAAGVRQDWMLDVAPWAVLRWGGEAHSGTATYDFAGWKLEHVLDPSRTAMHVPADSSANAVSVDGSRFGGYVAARVRGPGSALAELGVRADRATYSGDRVMSPRLNVSWEPRAGTTVRAALGRYSQGQALYELQASDGRRTFDPAERATQRVLGVDQTLPNKLRGRLEGYDRRVSVVRPRFVNAVGAVDAFPELGFDRVRIAPSASRARGVEALLSRDRGTRVDWAASYALASATDRIDGHEVPNPVDQRHTARGDWSLHPTSGRWRLSVAGLWHSGSPATPTIVHLDTVLTAGGALAVWPRWLPGPINSVRLPAYHRMDVRWTRYMETKRGRVSLFAEVFNLLGTHNQRNIYTNVDVHGTTATLQHGVSAQVPRIPTVGAAWEF